MPMFFAEKIGVRHLPPGAGIIGTWHRFFNGKKNRGQAPHFFGISSQSPFFSGTSFLTKFGASPHYFGASPILFIGPFGKRSLQILPII
jgi:hypothetical protein